MSFKKQVLVLIICNLLIFKIRSTFFESSLRNICLSQVCKNFCPMFLLEVLQFQLYISVCDPFIVYGVKQGGSEFITFHVDVQLFLHRSFCAGCPFSIELHGSFVQNQFISPSLTFCLSPHPSLRARTCVCVCVCVYNNSGLFSVPMICISVPIPIPHFLNYWGFIVSFKIKQCKIFFLHCFGYNNILSFHLNLTCQFGQKTCWDFVWTNVKSITQTV